MLDRVDRQVDVEVWLVEVPGLWLLDPEKGRNSSLPSRSSQKPCWEIFVISTSEVAAPGISHLLFVVSDQLLSPPRSCALSL
jgi:hypothetical protein